MMNATQDLSWANRRRLLVVHQDADLVQMVCQVGQAFGFEARFGSTAKDLFVHFEDLPPDVIVTDVTLENFDGFELIDWLCQTDYKSKIVLVAFAHQEYLLGAAKEFARVKANFEIATLVWPSDEPALRDVLAPHMTQFLCEPCPSSDSC